MQSFVADTLKDVASSTCMVCCIVVAVTALPFTFRCHFLLLACLASAMYTEVASLHVLIRYSILSVTGV